MSGFALVLWVFVFVLIGCLLAFGLVFRLT